MVFGMVNGVSSVVCHPNNQNEIRLNIVSFNVLNDIWLGPVKPNGQYNWYPDIDPKLLEENRRWVPIFQFLQPLVNTTDVFVIQEVSAREFNITSRLLDRFKGVWAKHDPEYWANQVKPPHTWEPNGQAIFMKRSTFNNIQTDDIALSNTGNHGAFASALHVASGKRMRFVGCHFDDGSENKRTREATAVVNYLETDRTNNIDFIVGDMNTGVVSTTTGVGRPVFCNVFEPAGFIDVATYMNQVESTHPWNPYVTAENPDGDASYDNDIDHITVRGATPCSFNVHNYDIMNGMDETERIADTAQRIGSDHFPLMASIVIPN